MNIPPSTRDKALAADRWIDLEEEVQRYLERMQVILRERRPWDRCVFGHTMWTKQGYGRCRVHADERETR